MRTVAIISLRVLGRLLHRSGPYLLLELLLPGGTLFALLLFLYRHNSRAVRRVYAPPIGVAVSRALGSVRDCGLAQSYGVWARRSSSQGESKLNLRYIPLGTTSSLLQFAHRHPAQDSTASRRLDSATESVVPLRPRCRLWQARDAEIVAA